MADLAICLQYWEGDRESAFVLARLLAELDRGRNERAVLVFVHRRDAAPPPLGVLEEVRKAFDVVVVAGTDLRTGYPDGCNGLWQDTVKWLASEPPELRGARWAWTMESDCIPLRRTWIADLVERADGCGAPIQGSFQPANPHINGNMVISTRPEVTKQLAAIKVPPKLAWDLWAFPKFEAIGVADPKHILSGWQTRTVESERLDVLSKGPYICVHGVKDDSAFQWAAGLFSSGETSITFGESEQGGLFRYPDRIPSCFRQGTDGRVMRFPPHQAGVQVGEKGPVFFQTKNGSRLGDLVAYRRQDVRRSDGKSTASTIRIARQQPDGMLWDQQEIHGLRTNASLGLRPEVFDNYEDPRLFRFRGQTWMAYVHGPYSPEYLTNQCVGRLSEDGTRVEEHLPLAFGNNSVSPRAIEKNWQFFEDQNQLRFVYTTYPNHVVFDVKTGRRWSSTPMGGAGNWRKKYGEPRGGTPPIRFGRVWISFFHSHVADLACTRRYFVGAYLFESASSNYQPTSFTAEPLVSSSKEDGFSMPLSVRSIIYNPAVVFPGSAEYTPDGKYIEVVSGLNEHSLSLHRFSVDSLKKSLRVRG